MNYSIIPLAVAAQTLSILLGGIQYNLTINYRDNPAAGWVLDIADSSNNPILQGIPFVTGADLLAQYLYLQLGGALVLYNGVAPDEVPTYENLGTDVNLYWVSAS